MSGRYFYTTQSLADLSRQEAQLDRKEEAALSGLAPSQDVILMDLASQLVKNDLHNNDIIKGDNGDGGMSEALRLALYQYGMEIRHLPLYRYLQSSPQYFPGWAWLVARRELRFSKIFDRIAELKMAKAWGPSLLATSAEGCRLRMGGTLEEQLAAQKTCFHSNQWDAVLEAVPEVAKEDMIGERTWKMAMAAILARQCQQRVLNDPKNVYLVMADTNNDRTTLHSVSVDFYKKDQTERTMALGMCTPIVSRVSTNHQQTILPGKKTDDQSFLETPPSTPQFSLSSHMMEVVKGAPNNPLHNHPENTQKPQEDKKDVFADFDNKTDATVFDKITWQTDEIAVLKKHMGESNYGLLAHLLTFYCNTRRTPQEVHHAINALQSNSKSLKVVDPLDLLKARVKMMRGVLSKECPPDAAHQPNFMPHSTVKRVKRPSTPSSSSSANKDSNVMSVPVGSPSIPASPAATSANNNNNDSNPNPSANTVTVSFIVHPTHDNALRKANLHLTKLLTPNELALRRLQRLHESSSSSASSAPFGTTNPNLISSASVLGNTYGGQQPAQHATGNPLYSSPQASTASAFRSGRNIFLILSEIFFFVNRFLFMFGVGAGGSPRPTTGNLVVAPSITMSGRPGGFKANVPPSQATAHQNNQHLTSQQQHGHALPLGGLAPVTINPPTGFNVVGQGAAMPFGMRPATGSSMVLVPPGALLQPLPPQQQIGVPPGASLHTNNNSMSGVRPVVMLPGGQIMVVPNSNQPTVTSSVNNASFTVPSPHPTHQPPTLQQNQQLLQSSPQQKQNQTPRPSSSSPKPE